MPTLEERKVLMRVALGKEKASLVIKGGNIVNVYSGELLEDVSVAIKNDRVAFVGKDADYAIGEDTEIINASGKIVAPGFVDGHFHLDMPLDEFLEHSIPSGTTTLFTVLDLGRTFGYEVAVAELQNMREQPVKLFGMSSFFFTPPHFLEPHDFALSTEEHRKLLDRDDVVASAEYTWTSVVREEARELNNISDTLSRNKTAEGHGAGAREGKLAAFIAAGVSSCHEPINLAEVTERARSGLYVMVREGTVRRDLEAISGIKDLGIDFRRLCLVTDGLGIDDLLSRGHMDFVVQKAIDLGIPPIKAFQMASLNPAEHFGMGDYIGGIAPGRYADIVILPAITKIECEYVISNGKIIAEKGKTRLHPRKCAYPESVLNSVHVPYDLKAEHFAVLTEDSRHRATVRVIKLVNELITREEQASLTVARGSILPDVKHDILKTSLIERKYNTGKIVTGFVHGFGLKAGAIASSSSWEHDSPLVVVGTNDEDIATAVNRIVKLQGGLVIAEDGRIRAEVPLRLGGFIALGPVEKTREAFRKVGETMKNLGSPLSDPFLTLMTLPGAFLPFFAISLQGLIDLRNEKIVPVIID